MTPLLDSTARRLTAEVARLQSAQQMPSVVAGVVRDGDLVWWTGRGRTVRRDSDQRPDADTQYKIGSVTKTFTAALVLLARERGDLALSDPVSRFLPDGPFPDASLRSLLAHSAGVSAEPVGSWWERSPGVDLDAFVAAHRDVPPVLEPGAQMHYSNAGYGVLGSVVEKVTGLTWFDAVREQLLDPLAMSRTTYQFTAPHAEGFAVHHLTGELTVEPLPDTGVMAPAGQLWSTVADLSRWLTALVDPDRSVLSRASLRAMATPQSAEPEARDGSGYGLGLQLHPGHGRALLGHSGSMPGFCCWLLADPDSRTGAIVLTNGAYGIDDIAARMVHLVLDEEPPLPEEWLPPVRVDDELRELVGLWYWGQAPSLLRLDREGIALGPVQSSGRSLVFRRTGRDTFVGTRGYHTGETLQVRRHPDGSLSHLEVATFVYTRTPYDPAAPIPGGAPGA